MQENNSPKKLTKADWLRIVIPPFLLLPLIPFYANFLGYLLVCFVAMPIFLFSLLRLIVWFFQWSWHRFRKQQFPPQYERIRTVLTLAIYVLIITVNAQARNQADRLALDLGVQVHELCEADGVCSIPQKFLAMGLKPISAGRHRYFGTFNPRLLGNYYKVRLIIPENRKSFQVLVFHAFEEGFTVIGRHGKKLVADHFPSEKPSGLLPKIVSVLVGPQKFFLIKLSSAQIKEADEWAKNRKPTLSLNQPTLSLNQWTSWMSFDEFYETYNKNQNNYFPSAIEGRYSKKEYEYRAVYEPFPQNQIYWHYFYGNSKNTNDEKIKDLISKGYVLLSKQTFLDSQNQEFYQAVWVTGKNKVVKCVKQGKKWFKSICE